MASSQKLFHQKLAQQYPRKILNFIDFQRDPESQFLPQERSPWLVFPPGAGFRLAYVFRGTDFKTQYLGLAHFDWPIKQFAPPRVDIITGWDGPALAKYWQEHKQLSPSTHFLRMYLEGQTASLQKWEQIVPIYPVDLEETRLAALMPPASDNLSLLLKESETEVTIAKKQSFQAQVLVRTPGNSWRILWTDTNKEILLWTGLNGLKPLEISKGQGLLTFAKLAEADAFAGDIVAMFNGQISHYHKLLSRGLLTQQALEF